MKMFQTEVNKSFQLIVLEKYCTNIHFNLIDFFKYQDFFSLASKLLIFQKYNLSQIIVHYIIFQKNSQIICVSIFVVTVRKPKSVSSLQRVFQTNY